MQMQYEIIGVEKHGALHNTRKHLESIYPNWALDMGVAVN